MSREATAMAERRDTASNEDRRESPRVPMRLEVRRAGGPGAFESCEGDVSLGGFAWYGGAAVGAGASVEVRFTLPGLGVDVEARGEVLQVTHGAQGPHAHARFVELADDAELAIARYLDDLRLSDSKR